MIYSSWNIEQNIVKVVILAHLFAFFHYFAFFLVILDHFLHFHPPKKQKIPKFWKNEKKQNKKQKKLEILSFYHKWQSYDVSFLRYGAWQTEFFVILDHFSLFHPPEKSKFWKNENAWRHISHKCTKNHDHMLHCSWDTMHDRCNSYFSFWAIFYPFTNDPKNQNF